MQYETSQFIDARLLVVDDDATNVTLVSAFLKGAGFVNVECETDSRTVMKRISECRPDLLFLDLNMPHKTGFDILSDLQSGTEGIEDLLVLVLTADTTSAAKHMALALGAHDFLTKPIDRVELTLRTKNLLAGQRLRRELRYHAEHLEEVVAARTAQLRESNLRLKEFDRLKSEFVATASHELRTPLTVIREFVSLLKDGAAGSTVEEIADSYNTVLRNCDRLGGLLDDLLDFHRIEVGALKLNRERLDISALLTQTVHDFAPRATANQCRLLLDLQGELGDVLADHPSIQRVLANLVGNAIKFTPSGGTVTVGARGRDGEVEVFVGDTGRGIAPEDMQKAFEPFGQINRTDEGPGVRGTGLGLPISRSIVEKHGGRLEAKSKVGKGTRFYFTLQRWGEERELRAFLSDAVESTQEQSPLAFVVLEGGPDPSARRELQEIKEICRQIGRCSDSFTVSDQNHCLVGVLEADAEGAKAFTERLDGILSKRHFSARRPIEICAISARDGAEEMFNLELEKRMQ